MLWAIPRHDALDRIGQDAATVGSLRNANAWRTGALTLGAAALLYGLARTMTERSGRM